MNKVITTLIVFSTMIASLNAAVISNTFSDDFTGSQVDFDATWNSQNVVLDTANDLVSMTHKKGDDSVKLFRNVGGTAGDYVNSVTFKTHTFDGTQADFQWRNSGASGYGYFAYNSSGKLRYYHSDGSNSKGKLFNGFDLGAGDGDTIMLKNAYDSATDIMTATYSLNGGEELAVFSGTGFNGTLGDLITGTAQFEVKQLVSDAGLQKPIIELLSVSLSAPVVVVVPPAATPEPSSYALMILGLFGLMLGKRRKEAQAA